MLDRGPAKSSAHGRLPGERRAESVYHAFYVIVELAQGNRTTSFSALPLVMSYRLARRLRRQGRIPTAAALEAYEYPGPRLPNMVYGIKTLPSTSL